MKEDPESEIINVKGLELWFHQDDGVVKALNGVDFHLKQGESIGIGGESGCGKTVTASALMGLIQSGGRIVGGEILLRRKDGGVIDLAKLPRNGRDMQEIRKREMSMIFQEPSASLSPLHSIGHQISEALPDAVRKNRNTARDNCIELLRKVGIPEPEQRVDEYSFRLSGGMCQRAMIAQALAKNPRILIADEPTTSLDVTVQAQVLQLMDSLRRTLNLSLILITHNMGVLAHMVERIYIMYLGKVVEEGPTEVIFNNPKHPYTRGLIKCVPKLATDREADLESIAGTVPSGYSLPDGCAFHPRCVEAIHGRCSSETPQMIQVGAKHRVACLLYGREGEDSWTVH